jgi:hypothetical protein
MAHAINSEITTTWHLKAFMTLLRLAIPQLVSDIRASHRKAAVILYGFPQTLQTNALMIIGSSNSRV